MAFLLHIETSAKRCSVAISNDQTLLATEGITADNYVHAEALHVLIEQTLLSCNVAAKQLDAVAVSKGPGSYTGLRIGVSAAKGFGYALDIPVIALDTTEIIAHHAASIAPEMQRYVAMIDARRMEVYCASFDGENNRMSADEAKIVDEAFLDQFDPQKTIFTGDGAWKVAQLQGDKFKVLSFLPSAEMMIINAHKRFALKQYEDLAYFEPFYLKDYLPGVTKKTLV